MSTSMLPEVAALHRSGPLVRIPPDQDVPLSNRVSRLLDTAPLRRLKSISQLGMVALVYPGATHSRFEHTLGVYHNSLRLLARFADDSAFTSLVSETTAEAFVVASLVHDLGHWPFCHPLEDMCLRDLGEHESRVRGWLNTPELAECLEEDWSCEANDVVGLLDPDVNADLEPDQQLLATCLSGPIDVDKLDYLQRDSLHCGVPYGRNFDVGRLITSMCVHPDQPCLAVGEKGRTAAEMMVFARYVMFSEVYWHHAVRAATAMLQRAVFLLQNRIDIEASLRLDDAAWIAMLRRIGEGSVAEPLVEGIFGRRRRLYKRVAEFNFTDGVDVHQRLARRPYWWLIAVAEKLAAYLSSAGGMHVDAADVLIDAPPVKLEVDINIDVVRKEEMGQSQRVHRLGDVSPVASILAHRQFDNHVKRVRVFVRSEVRDRLVNQVDWYSTVSDAIESVERELV